MRRWLADLIYPEGKRERDLATDRYVFLLNRLDELNQWCAYDFAMIRDIHAWLSARYWVHFMPLNEYDRIAKSDPALLLKASDITEFRDKLRDRYSPARKAQIAGADSGGC